MSTASAQTLCRTCGRVVTASPLRAGADPSSATFFTVDDHAGADGRCPAVGDVVQVGAVRWRDDAPCAVCGLADERARGPHGIGGHMNASGTWQWCPGGGGAP